MAATSEVLMAASSEVLTAALSSIREPCYGVRVHRDECVLSFSSPQTAGGLYVCMRTFLGFGPAHVDRHHARTGQRAYLHILRTRKKEEDDTGTDRRSTKKKSPPTRLAIGVEGGFDVEPEAAPQYEQRVALVLFPDRREVSPEELRAMPEAVREAVGRSWNAILSSSSASHGLRAAQWHGEERRPSRHANGLRQLANGVRVGGAGPWVCAQEGCGLTQNLWMNLTDGTVLCGRSQYGGLEGNSHAVRHFHRTGFPLAVALGTVTPEGADVHSYEEQDMVLDPRLREHLAHFGLDMSAAEKTERTITDLELEVNQREWDSLQEAGSALRPLSGPGLTGMRNLGNSCYLNAVMQVLFSVPDFRSKYVTEAERVRDEAPLARDPTQDFNTQTAKLGHGLLSGDFSRAGGDDKRDAASEGEQEGIAPRMFKALVGRGHAEFSTNRQQDAQEFLMHVLDLAERHRGSGPDPAEAFRFLVEERIECGRSRRAKYARRADYLLQLPVPMERATNLAEVRDAPEGTAVRARVPFSACLAALSEPEALAGFWSSAARARTAATKTTRFATFPDHLVIAVKKFTFSGPPDLTPRKLDVSIDVPDSLDLSALRGTGRRPGEELLPEEEEEEEEEEEGVLSTLGELGFSREACRKAVRLSDGGGVEAAVNWLMDHSGDDPDLSSSATPPTGGAWQGGGGAEEEEGGVAQIMEMNFSRETAVRALRATGNAGVEGALDWILTQDPGDPSPSSSPSAPTEPTAPPPPRDGPGRYELFAFISHMGSSTLCGHYVCHIKKEGEGWVIFNDQKVCASENPPKDLGYLYFYRRVTYDL